MWNCCICLSLRFEHIFAQILISEFNIEKKSLGSKKQLKLLFKLATHVFFHTRNMFRKATKRKTLSTQRNKWTKQCVHLVERMYIRQMYTLFDQSISLCVKLHLRLFVLIQIHVYFAHVFRYLSLSQK